MEEQKRLEAFEAMLEAVEREYDAILSKMEQLKKDGRVKSVTYRQLMGRKAMYRDMLDLYEIYGLLSKKYFEKESR